ncbi:MAG: DNA repair protein RadA [Ignavibacteriales bacterium]
MSKTKIKYVCGTCGFESLKWLGKCPSCDSWNSFSEEVVESKKNSAAITSKNEVRKLISITSANETRIKTNIGEFDRVLGGGITQGSVVLIGGDPGIGKSTLVLQSAEKIQGIVLYVTGEESLHQIKLRAERLKVNSENILVLPETELDVILSKTEEIKPTVVIIDSIQTVSKSDFENAPGTVTQIRECTAMIMQFAKQKNIPFILIGHVTKEGYIAGPKVLEHIVDTVLQFEGERTSSFRILRSQKNRFGSTNEIGIFEMHDSGLKEVINPSDIFLGERNKKITGSVITASIEGTRPVLLEVQALVTPSNFGNPQRVTTGFDYRRLSILLAVLEKRARLRLSSTNVFLNLAGGLRIEEPAIDLAVCSAIASSMLDKPSPSDFIVLGEVGLGGEIRAVSHIEKRITEAEKLGFKKALLPNQNKKSIKNGSSIELIFCDNISSALEILFEAK